MEKKTEKKSVKSTMVSKENIANKKNVTSGKSKDKSKTNKSETGKKVPSKRKSTKSNEKIEKTIVSQTSNKVTKEPVVSRSLNDDKQLDKQDTIPSLKEANVLKQNDETSGSNVVAEVNDKSNNNETIVKEKKTEDNKIKSDSTQKPKQEKNSKAKKETPSKKKKPSTKKTPKVSSIVSTKIDPKTGMLIDIVKQNKKDKEKKKIEVTPKDEKVAAPQTKKKRIKKAVPTIEPSPVVPKEIVRPTAKKEHKFTTKEDKKMYHDLQDAFREVANMTMVIEERVMDKKAIPDLTIGELHVVEMVNELNNKPVSTIANKLHITVGAFITCMNRLVQKDYLIRTRDEMDHRIILLSVSQKAKKVLKTHDKFHSDILGMVLDSMTLQQATKVMSQFAFAIEAYYDPSLLEKQNDEKPKKNRKK